MHFSAFVALTVQPVLSVANAIPAVIAGRPRSSEVQVLKPTMGEFAIAYPDVPDMIINNETSSSLAIDATDPVKNVGYKVAAGTVSVIGYWAVDGQSRIYSAIKSCRSDEGITGVECGANYLAVGATHFIAGFGGFLVGYRLFSWLRRGGILSVVNVPVPTEESGRMKRDTCPAYHVAEQLPYDFTGDYAFKFGWKDNCFAAYEDELPYVESLMHQIVQGMIDPATFASSTDFTFYSTSSREVIGRFRMALDDNEDNYCTFDISGSDSCTV